MNATDYQPLSWEEHAPLRELLHRCRDTQRYIRAVLELTYRCNFKCPHCYVHTDRSNHGERERELSTAEWLSVIDQLADDGCLVLTLTGGEVLVRRDWFELALHARARRFVLRIFTNASYIDDAVADRLAEVQPVRVEVSLYGATEASYRAIAGHEIYLEQSCRGIDRLIERGLSVALKTPLMRQNFADFAGMVELARTRWGCRIGFSAQMVPRDDRSISPLDCELTPEQFGEYLRTAPRSKPVHDRPDDRPPCTVARDYLVISPFGDVFPCVNIKRSVGNVRERPIREIWDSAPFLQRLREIRRGDFKPYMTEQERRWVPPCPGMAFRDTGSPVGQMRFAATAARMCEELGTEFQCGCG